MCLVAQPTAVCNPVAMAVIADSSESGSLCHQDFAKRYEITGRVKLHENIFFQSVTYEVVTDDVDRVLRTGRRTWSYFI